MCCTLPYVTHFHVCILGTSQARPQYPASAPRPATQTQQTMVPGQLAPHVSQPTAGPSQPSAYQYQQQKVCHTIQHRTYGPSLQNIWLVCELMKHCVWSYRARLPFNSIFKHSHICNSKGSTASSNSCSSSSSNIMPTRYLASLSKVCKLACHKAHGCSRVLDLQPLNTACSNNSSSCINNISSSSNNSSSCSRNSSKLVKHSGKYASAALLFVLHTGSCLVAGCCRPIPIAKCMLSTSMSPCQSQAHGSVYLYDCLAVWGESG